MKATQIAEQTLFGIIKNDKTSVYQSGNCFGVMADDGQHYRIVNMYIENLEICGVGLPVEIKKICNGVAIVVDRRIPRKFYRKGYCEICCPQQYLLKHQKKRIAKEIKDGIREERDGMIIYHLKAKERKLKTKFVVAPFVEVYHNADSEKEIVDMMADMMKEKK